MWFPNRSDTNRSASLFSPMHIVGFPMRRLICKKLACHLLLLCFSLFYVLVLIFAQFAPYVRFHIFS